MLFEVSHKNLSDTLTQTLKWLEQVIYSVTVKRVTASHHDSGTRNLTMHCQQRKRHTLGATTVSPVLLLIYCEFVVCMALCYTHNSYNLSLMVYTFNGNILRA